MKNLQLAHNSALVLGLWMALGAQGGFADDAAMLGKGEPGTDKAIALVDDFEDGYLDGWMDGGGGCGAVASSATAGSGTYSMLIAGGCGHFGGRYFDIVDFPAQSVSVKLRPGAAGSATSYFVLGDDNVTTNWGVVFLYARNNGHWNLVGPGGENYDCGVFTPYAWHDVQLSIDWSWKTVNIWIDGELRHVHVPFRSPSSTTLTTIHVYNISSDISNYDDIVMSVPPPMWPLFTDGFESGDGSSWSSSQPAVPPRLYLYDGGTVNGAIGGRRGADIMCYQAASSLSAIPYGVMTRALLSVDSDDEIRDMPANYGVPTNRALHSTSGVKVADSWADLLDGSIDIELDDAGVQTATSFWYSGSYDNGALAPENCSGWTDGVTGLDGRYGLTGYTDGRWIDNSNAGCGSPIYHVLCVAWQ